MANVENSAGGTSPPELDWVELNADNSDLLLVLKEECEASGETPAALSFTELPLSEGEPQIRGILALNSNGVAQAAALVSLVAGDTPSCVALGYTKPTENAPHLWSEMIKWQMREAKHLLRAAGKLKGASIEVQVHPYQQALEHTLRSKGFSWINSTVQLRRDLDDLPTAPDLGAYLQVEQWGENHDEDARRLFNRLLAHDRSFAPYTKETWSAQWQNSRQDWSFVGVERLGDRPEMAGFILAGEISRSKGEQNIKDGGIDLLVVGDGETSSELFQSLSLAAMQAQQSDGLETTTVIVEEPGDPLTTRLYEGLGFSRQYEVRTYAASF